MTVTAERRMLLGRVHAAKKGAGLDDDAYRDLLERETGKRSAADCSDGELQKVLTVFHGKRQGARETPAYVAKIRALWIALWNLAGLEAGDDRALDAFVRRQTGKLRLQFVEPGEARALTEALKDMLRREGFVVPENDPGGRKARQALLQAQWRKLHAAGKVKIGDDAALDRWAEKRYLSFRGAIIHLSVEQLDDAARQLGTWLRKVPKP